MKTHLQNLFFLPAFILALSLLPAGRVMAQTFTFGSHIHSGSADITYTGGKFQYTDIATSSDDDAGLPLAGSAASIITTSNQWTATLSVNLAARSMTATNVNGPYAGMGLFILLNNGVNAYAKIALEQENYNQSANYGYFHGTIAAFEVVTNGNDVQTTPLGASKTSVYGESYEPLSGGTNTSPATEPIDEASGLLTLTFNPVTDTLTGSYNGSPVGSYSLAAWGAKPPLILLVAGYSGGGVGVPAGTDTASNFYAGRFPASVPTYAITTTSSPAAGGTTSGAGSYTNGQSVTVTATPNGCYNFTSWTIKSKVQSTEANYTFTVTNNEALVANFTLKEDAIATESNPVKGGATTGKGTFGCDKNVTVRATAAAGYKFISWTVGAPTVSTANPYTFPAEVSETLTANFADVSVPVVTITSPKPKQQVDTTLLAVSGTAKNVLGVSDVVLTLNGNRVATTTTNQWTNWSASVLLLPGTNVISANALSEAGNPSATETVTFENAAGGAAPVALAGLIGEVQMGASAPFEISFGTVTFAQFSADTNQGSGVGNYTYTQTGPDTAILATSAFAPPGQKGGDGTQLTFTSPASATFTNGDGTTGTLTLAAGLGLDVSSQAGWTITTAEPNSATTTFGDGTFSRTDGASGGYTSMQYGPMAALVVLTNADPSGGVDTNYNLLMFTSRSNGQWFVTYFDGAGDPPSYNAGTFTGTYHANGLHYVAPASLNGISVLVTPLQKTDNPIAATASFGQATGATTYTSTNGSDKVANYTYTRTGTNTAILILQSIAPLSSLSTSDNSETLYVTFKSSTSATYTNLNGSDFGKLTLTTVPSTGYFAPVALPPNVTIDFSATSGSGSASFNNGSFTSTKHSGTYTYAQFSPTVGMIIFTYTDTAAAGEVDYFQMTFNSVAGGSAKGDGYDTENNGDITIGTFKLVK